MLPGDPRVGELVLRVREFGAYGSPGRVDLLRGSLRSYLGVVAHRRAVDEVRRCERRTRIESTLPPLGTEAGPEPEVIEASTQAWRKRRLAEGLAMLPNEQRVALELAYYDGMTY